MLTSTSKLVVIPLLNLPKYVDRFCPACQAVTMHAFVDATKSRSRHDECHCLDCQTKTVEAN